jgi:hypothetical protein
MALWPFRKRDFQQIKVQFVDATKRITFAPCTFEADRLPASFEAHTVMHAGSGDWEVLEARPVTAAEFRRTGKLTLIVRKVEKGVFDSVDDVLFSLPTIANEMPGPEEGSTKINKNTLELHEDDWRQVEWVAASHRPAIEAEFAAIRDIYEHHRIESGFKEIHVRERLPAPLSTATISFQDLLAIAGPHATRFDGISWSGLAGITADSFAFKLLSSIEIYGISRGTSVIVTAFQNTRTNNVAADDLQNLATFAARHNLLLVDWCRTQLVEPDISHYRGYFVDSSPGD